MKVSALWLLLLEMVCAYNFSQSQDTILPSAAIFPHPFIRLPFGAGHNSSFPPNERVIAICSISLRAGGFAIANEAHVLQFCSLFWSEALRVID